MRRLRTGARTRATGLVAIAAAVAMGVAGCGGGAANGGAGLQGSDQSQALGKQDINARDVATLKDGGDLRIAADQLPDNWNPNQVDGTVIDGTDMSKAILPWVYTADANNEPKLNTDYVTKAELTSTSPEVVTYTINPKATWASGRPITWEDFAAQATALNGTNQAYQVSSTTGYELIDKVTRGTDDKQAVVTFKSPFGEWQALFSPLLPKETNADPNLFNTGWVDKPLDTAGPFKIGQIDKTGKTVTMVRDDKWWGTAPKLSRVIFKVLERNAFADAMANNEIDYYKIGSSVDLFKRAKAIPGVSVRQGPDPSYNQVTFNGSPTAITGDVKIRQAIAKSIDRTGIATRLIGQIVPNPQQVGNHLYPVGSKYYQDNSADEAYDPQGAAAILDGLGWKLDGTVRKKDGKPLTIRLVETAGNPISEAIDKTLLDQLSKVGITLTIDAVPSATFFKDYVTPGNFEMVGFGWNTTSTPLSSSFSIYQSPSGDNARQNFGRISSPQIDKDYQAAIAELDPVKRAALGNAVDKEIWGEVHHIPLYAATGAVASRDTFGNLGAKGFADWDFTKIGLI